MVQPYITSEGIPRTPIIPQIDSILVKKNPANHIARFGAYPSRRIFLAIRVQKFPIIVIIDQARIIYLYTYTPSGSINRLSDVLWENARRIVAGFSGARAVAYRRGT